MPNVVNLNATRKRGKNMATLKSPPQFIVTVTRDGDIWIAECEILGLVTEADSYETLEERALLIASELCIENGLCEAGEEYCIRFDHLHCSRVAL